MQCGVIIAACAQTLRHAEHLYGKPGSTVLCFGAADQQELQARERLVSQLLRKKARFSIAQAASLLRVLASSQNAVGAWLPIELLLERLRESVLPALDDPDLQRAHRQLLAAPYALQRDNEPTPYKPLVDALLAPAR